jgi:hypothetical protein
VSWDAIIATSEVISAIAIIASLIYVAVQIRQNNSIARSTIIHGTNSDAMRFPELIVQNAEVAAIYQKGTNGESLTGNDLVRFLGLIEVYLIWLEDSDSQAEVGLFFQDDELVDFVDYMSGDFAPFFSTPEARRWWHGDAKHYWRPSFARKISKYVDEPE